MEGGAALHILLKPTIVSCCYGMTGDEFTFLPIICLFYFIYFIAAQTEPKQEGGNQDQGHDEMDMGDMDKLEQDTGNIGEVLLSRFLTIA